MDVRDAETTLSACCKDIDRHCSDHQWKNLSSGYFLDGLNAMTTYCSFIYFKNVFLVMVSQSVSHSSFLLLLLLLLFARSDFFHPRAKETRRGKDGRKRWNVAERKTVRERTNERMKERDGGSERKKDTERGRKEAIWINAIICTHTHIHRKQSARRERETPTTTVTRHPTDYVVFSFALRLSFRVFFFFALTYFITIWLASSNSTSNVLAECSRTKLSQQLLDADSVGTDEGKLFEKISIQHAPVTLTERECSQSICKNQTID